MHAVRSFTSCYLTQKTIEGEWAEAVPSRGQVSIKNSIESLQEQNSDGEGLTEVAQLTLPAIGTEALKGVHSINAGASVPTAVVDAVVNI